MAPMTLVQCKQCRDAVYIDEQDIRDAAGETSCNDQSLVQVRLDAPENGHGPYYKNHLENEIKNVNVLGEGKLMNISK